MKASIVTLIALGMVAAFCAALLTASMGRPGTVDAAPLEPVEVLVAARDMPSMTIVTEDAFERTTLPPGELPAGAIRQPVQIIGKPLARAVVKGQPLTRDCFALNSLGVELVATMPRGKRAVTVELALSSGLEGLLYPGCLVDVLATFRIDQRNGDGAAVSTTLLQGVEVIAIDSATVSTSEASAGERAAEDVNLRRKTRRVTLMVDPRQAEALQLATEHGSVALAMRNPLDDGRADAEPTLLSQGRLASLAEYLESSLAHETGRAESTASDEPAATAPPPTEQATAASTGTPARRRDITVLRGTDVEVRSLREDDVPAVRTAERL